MARPRDKEKVQATTGGRREAYLEKLRDPRWQKKRLEVFERDNWTCLQCGSTEKTLNVHHRVYADGYEPWDVRMGILETLCEECHEKETSERREVEQHLMLALRGIGVPWYGIDMLAHKLIEVFPPLPREQAITVIAVLLAWIPQLAERIGLALPETEENGAEGVEC